MADEQRDERAEVAREEAAAHRAEAAPTVVEESVAIPLDPTIAADVLAGEAAEDAPEPTRAERGGGTPPG